VPAVQEPLNAAAIEAFVDGVVESAMRRDHVAGVGVGVFHRGERLLLKGYGQADDTGRQVDPERTLFRIASISKTFTWISIMQLVEAGKVKLDAPANDYLPPTLQIPADGMAKPVLVRHLLTHTAGFEDLYAGHLFVADAKDASPMVTSLSRHRPKRVRPPGQVAIYSNYGTALAGFIVQHVTGTPFESYVEQNVLAPLGLQNTTFREPYPPRLTEDLGLPSPMSPALRQDLSAGFRWRAGAFESRPFEHVVQFAPAGSVSATPADMTRYMGALLSGGAGVLKPETIALFASETPLFANGPGLNGLAYGMMQSRTPMGWRSWGHSGDTLWFHSEMAIYPDLDLGIFITTNSEAGARVRALLPDMLADRIAGRPAAPVYAAGEAATPTAALGRFAGSYMAERRAFSTGEKILCLAQCQIDVSAVNDALVISSGDDAARVWPIDSVDDPDGSRIHRFRDVVTGGVVGFEERGGRIIGLYGAGGVSRAERVSPILSPSTAGLILAFGALVSFLAMASGLSRFFTRRAHGTAAQFAGILTPAAGAAWLVSLAGLAAFAQGALFDNWSIFVAWPGQGLTLAAWGAAAAGGLSVLAIVATLAAWLRADWSIWRRARILVTLTTFLALAGTLYHWNMLWPQF
jgi:CubicO group peptidase (beta-lactamase class C family)